MRRGSQGTASHGIIQQLTVSDSLKALPQGISPRWLSHALYCQSATKYPMNQKRGIVGWLRISCFEFVELGRKYSSFSSTELRHIFATANVSKTGKLSY